jgi:hypothetical protein
VVFGEFWTWFFALFWRVEKRAANRSFHRRNFPKRRAKEETKLALEYTHIITDVASPKKVTLYCIKHASNPS